MNRKERRRTIKGGKHWVTVTTGIGKLGSTRLANERYSAHASLVLAGKLDQSPKAIYTGSPAGAPYLVKEAMLFLRENHPEEWRQVVIEQAALLKADGVEGIGRKIMEGV